MRLYRIITMIMLLANNKILTARELAERFEVSPRTIYRDIETIEQAGVPIVAHQGIHGGFSIMDGYIIDKQVLTTEEMLAVILGLKGVGVTFADSKVKDTVEKIKGLIPEKEKYRVENNNVFIDLKPWGSSKELKAIANQLRATIAESRLIAFEYTNTRGETVEREVEPMTLVLRGNSLYLYGFCRLRGDYRIFKLSRINHLRELNEFFERRGEEFSEDYCEQSWEENSKKVDLLLKFKGKLRVQVEECFPKESIEESGNSLLVSHCFPEDNWLYGFILSFGDGVEVLKPDYIREIIRKAAVGILKIYK